MVPQRTLMLGLCAATILTLLALTPPASAQTLGTVTGSTLQTACPSGRGFDPNMTCYLAMLSSCPGADDLPFYYGVETPSGTPKGTIVILPGMGGDNAQESSVDSQYVQYYVSNHFQVVEVAWGGQNGGYDWELTNVNSSNNASNIRVAACRPASFLNWARITLTNHG